MIDFTEIGVGQWYLAKVVKGENEGSILDDDYKAYYCKSAGFSDSPEIKIMRRPQYISPMKDGSIQRHTPSQYSYYHNFKVKKRLSLKEVIQWYRDRNRVLMSEED